MLIVNYFVDFKSFPFYFPVMTITNEQCRAARALIGISQRDFAKSIGVSESTLKDFEAGRRVPHANNLDAIQTALEKSGVSFIDNAQASNSGGVGVRFNSLKSSN